LKIERWFMECGLFWVSKDLFQIQEKELQPVWLRTVFMSSVDFQEIFSMIWEFLIFI